METPQDLCPTAQSDHLTSVSLICGVGKGEPVISALWGVKSVVMVSSCAPTVADLFMDHFESEYFLGNEVNPFFTNIKFPPFFG